MTLNKTTVKSLAFGVPAGGLVCVIIYAFTAARFGTIAHALGTFILTAGAAFITGLLIGFLFGIPKSAEPQPGVSAGMYSANTNLEQISDWLTKILLGIGLTQMGEIAKWVGRTSDYMANNMTLDGHEAMFIASLMIFFVVCGFLDGYLATRIILPRVFAKSSEIARLHDADKNVITAEEKVENTNET
jgi:hypothetical protein